MFSVVIVNCMLMNAVQEKFVMSRTLTPKQKKIARAAKPRNKITGADFKKLKKNKKARRA